MGKNKDKKKASKEPMVHKPLDKGQKKKKGK